MPQAEHAETIGLAREADVRNIPPGLGTPQRDSISRGNVRERSPPRPTLETYITPCTKEKKEE
jgi:hypothetical protein